MSELTNYIKEMIEQLKEELKKSKTEGELTFYLGKISVLQAVLSKIEELGDDGHVDKIGKACDDFKREFVETKGRSVLDQELNK